MEEELTSGGQNKRLYWIILYEIKLFAHGVLVVIPYITLLGSFQLH